MVVFISDRKNRKNLFDGFQNTSSIKQVLIFFLFVFFTDTAASRLFFRLGCEQQFHLLLD